MPREDRSLIFDFRELYQAIYSLAQRRSAERLPPGLIAGVSFRDDKKAIVLKIENPLEGTIREVAYSADFVAAALMSFCQHNKIPMARRARKFIELEPNSVILRMVI